MIYTVTFNPSIDYIVTVKDFKLGLVNRTSEELMFPGYFIRLFKRETGMTPGEYRARLRQEKNGGGKS